MGGGSPQGGQGVSGKAAPGFVLAAESTICSDHCTYTKEPTRFVQGFIYLGTVWELLGSFPK